MPTKLASFRAEDAERITGMSVAQQHIKRSREQLTPLTGRNSLTAFLLAEMSFVEKVAKLDLNTGIKNLSVRGKAAKWIAYWALMHPLAFPERTNVADQEKISRKLLHIRTDQEPVQFMVLPVASGVPITWKNVAWTNNPEDIREAATITISLKMLGENIAEQAGTLVEISQ